MRATWAWISASVCDSSCTSLLWSWEDSSSMTRKRQSCFRLSSSATWAEGLQDFKFPANVSSRRSTARAVRASNSSRTDAGAYSKRQKSLIKMRILNETWTLVTVIDCKTLYLIKRNVSSYFAKLFILLQQKTFQSWATCAASYDSLPQRNWFKETAFHPLVLTWAWTMSSIISGLDDRFTRTFAAWTWNTKIESA